MKAGSRPQYYRIRRMVQMVREGSVGGNPPNSKDFMAELGTSRRTVARDLDFLRDEERAPLEYDDAQHGFRLTDETYALPPVTISRREAFSFGLARKLLAHYEGTPLHLDMRSVLDKIAESLEGDISIEPNWLSEHVGVLPEDRVRINPEVWAQLAGFIERRESVRAEYQTFTGRVSEYELHPYHLLAYHGNWYVLARNVAKNQVETFALSRFRRIETGGSPFTRPPDFSPETFARQAFGITGGEEPLKVRLLFEPKLVVYITERQWHSTQEFRVRADGRVEMRLETTGRKELIRWVLSWMPDVKVLAPKSLHDRIVEKLITTLNSINEGGHFRAQSKDPALNFDMM
jgi:predicted DNA-binding transcriptional regulator YafY